MSELDRARERFERSRDDAAFWARRVAEMEAAEKPAEPSEVDALRAEVGRLIEANLSFRRRLASIKKDRDEVRVLLAEIGDEIHSFLSRREGNDGGGDEAPNGEDHAGPYLSSP